MGGNIVEKEMTIIDHLSELRKRIIITVVSFVLFTAIGLYFANSIYAFLTRNLHTKLAILSPGDILWIYFTLAALLGITLTIPIAAFQVWLFVKPALTEKEQNVTLLYVPFLFFSFILGIAFGYFVILPMILHFLTILGGDLFQTMYTVDRYFSFVFTFTLPFGILFELPLVMFFLTSLGILQPALLRKIRRYAYFGLVVLGVSISPPDFLSHSLVSGSLIILYEISVWVSSLAYRKRQKRIDAIREERDTGA